MAALLASVLAAAPRAASARASRQGGRWQVASSSSVVVAEAEAAGGQQLQDPELEKMQRLLDDEEVSLVRRLQQGVRLFDTKRQTFVSLPDLLVPGQPLHDADVVCIGELHDNEDDHAAQRLILDALTYSLFLELRRGEGISPKAPNGRTPQNNSPQKLALGVEYFSRQQQPVLDDLIFGEAKESGQAGFRKAVDWENSWAFDWSIYAPLFRFCQLNLTRIVGLNIPYEAIQIVSRGGLDGLPDWLRPLLPELDLSQKKHRRRFEDMLRMPLEDAVARMRLPVGEGGGPKPELDRMYQAQVVWDEFMADSARRYLDARGGRMVLFAGTNHAWRDAIPDRFERQARGAGRPRRAVSIVPWHGEQDVASLPRAADYLLCMRGEGGVATLAAELSAQRLRLQGRPRVFPAGYL